MRKAFISFICILTILLCGFCGCYAIEESTSDSGKDPDSLLSLESTSDSEADTDSLSSLESASDSEKDPDSLPSSDSPNGLDFELLITINKTVFTEKEEIKVEMFLKNNNSFDIEIAYYFLYTAIIPTATRYPVATEWPPEAYVRNFKAGDNIKRKDYLGGCFDIGVHEIKYKAEFYINWGEENQQKIEVLSNVLQIEIIGEC